MKEYEKIESIYKREMTGSRKLIEGEFNNPIVSFLRNVPWICTEKIDGTNIGVVWDGHRVSFQGRTERAQIPTKLLTYLEDTFLTNEMEEMFEQMFGDKNVIIFGEGYGAKIQNGGLYRSDNSFIAFDVNVDGKYLSRSNAEEVCKAIGIDMVPVIMCEPLKEAVSFVKSKPKSTIGQADMEGLVCRPQIVVYDWKGNRVTVKIKVRDF